MSRVVVSTPTLNLYGFYSQPVDLSCYSWMICIRDRGYKPVKVT